MAQGPYAHVVVPRFNRDKSQGTHVLVYSCLAHGWVETYDGELERMNSSIATENQGLQYDNKQLGILIREYEQTVETAMSAFRTRAVSVSLADSTETRARSDSWQHDVQEHELGLVREYEARLLSKESENLLCALTASAGESESLGRISQALRSLMRSLNGEGAGGEETDGEDEDEDGVLEREIELARLQFENGVLKRMLGLPVIEMDDGGERRAGGGGGDEPLQLPVSPPPGPGEQTRRMLGGASGTVGPFGTYKRRPG